MKSLLIAVLMIAGTAQAQTLAPPISEFSAKQGKTVRGTFQVQNNGLAATTFELEVSDMTLDNTGRHLNPVPPTEHVIVTPSSGRLGPKEIRSFDYQITCDTPTCAVLFRVGMTIGHTKELLVKAWVEHAVYVSDSKHPRMDALQIAGLVLKQ